MLRIGPPRPTVARQNPEQERLLWQRRCVREEPTSERIEESKHASKGDRVKARDAEPKLALSSAAPRHPGGRATHDTRDNPQNPPYVLTRPQPSVNSRQANNNDVDARADKRYRSNKPGVKRLLLAEKRPESAMSSDRSSARSSSSTFSRSSSSYSVSSFSSSSSQASRRSSRSMTSQGSARSSAGLSLSSFGTNDSGFTAYASQKFEEFERALEEERQRRQSAEAKLDKLMALLQAKHGE